MQEHDRHLQLKRRLSDITPTTAIVVMCVGGGILFLACLLYVAWTRCHCKHKAAARPPILVLPKTIDAPKHSIIVATSRDPMWMIEDTWTYFPTAEGAQFVVDGDDDDDDDDDDIYVSGYSSNGDIYLTGATDAMLFRSEVSMISVGSSVE
ncbi:Aste57867_21761 [Aphanomyces stellatus]|uniref:Aste57867_21761 protein n=1 Tax=Aphanomyces stellatus TaxID=120398 RepID=A0A485LID6_9STRA|nr:hypothetical protein As57867_021692 [Aphanomyces stellatus]VFT98430.1 Aste57867_21761 [Aphanomyces stellatus]